MTYVKTVPEKSRNIECPSCGAVICARCVELENRTAINQYDRCSDCHRALKRWQAAYFRRYRREDHGEVRAGERKEDEGRCV